ncbi:glycosyltransferase [Aeromonas veronii]|uniref:glycosyltransferase n=1 Tax=Aeromonas veronii TaxID=654 RepID=UPI00217F1F86|nr:glycosyltransferase [Aeromonas veronii]UWH26748.1 glycosyltransferase [Aeromonas veronii]
MKKYIVIPSGGIGGAEKRFFDIFTEMRKIDKNIFLVLPYCLMERLVNGLDCTSVDGVIVLDVKSWSPLRFFFLLYKNVIIKSRRDDSFHYPLNPPFFLHFYPLRRFSISFCYCVALPKFSLTQKGICLQWLASFFASKIDILNKNLFEKFQHTHPYLSEKSSLTPGGTFLSPFRGDIIERSYDFVFIARLEPSKGLQKLFEIMPIINDSFRHEPVSFHIFGEGSLETFLRTELKKLTDNGINVFYHGYTDSSAVLPITKTVLSLQEITNYPSRVVGEALACGCEVIILDVGDSRAFGEHLGIYYLDEDFGNLQRLIDVVRLTDLRKRKFISEQSKMRYSSRSYIDYYFNII